MSFDVVLDSRVALKEVGHCNLLLSKLLVHGRPQRRHEGAPGASRRYPGGRLARTALCHRALSPTHGLAVLKDDANEVFHTYSTYGRGVEVMMATYNMLDLTPKGRDERDVEYKMEWLRHHDRYEPTPVAKALPATGSVDGLFDSLKNDCCH
jgi:hypothetical protein